MSSVSLQNSVRLRIFLVLVLSIAIRIARPFSSTSVHKATRLLEINYIVYGIVLLCTLMPNKTAWMLAICAIIGGGVIGGACLMFALVATVRCMSGSQMGCIHSAPADIAINILVGGTTLLDLFQVWTIYRILRIKAFSASSTQRLRILFAWAWPFAWLVNIVLWSESTWTFWTLSHLMVDPTIIVLATTDETFLLWGLMGVVLLSDIIALLQVNISLARWGIVTSLALTCVGLLMLWVPTDHTTKNTRGKSETPVESETPTVEISKPKKTLTRRKKSDATRISF